MEVCLHSHPNIVGSLELLHETAIDTDDEKGRRNVWQRKKMVHSSVCYFYCCSRREIPEPDFWLLYTTRHSSQRYRVIKQYY